MSRGDKSRVPPHLPPSVLVGSLALLPFAEFVAANLQEPFSLARIALYAAAAVILAVAVLILVTRRDPQRMPRIAVLEAAFLWLFFHVPTIGGWWDAMGLTAPDTAQWAIIAALTLAVLLPLSRRKAVQTWAMFVGPVLLLGPMVLVATGATSQPAEARTLLPALIEDHELVRPVNVYYFLADGYASEEVIAEEVGADIGPFITALEGDGFVVSEDARANYPNTLLSIPSTLAMDYLVEEGHEFAHFGGFSELIRGNNPVRHMLDDLGYSYVHAHSGILEGFVCGEGTDLCIGDSGPFDDTDWGLLLRTPLAEAIAGATEVNRLAVNADPSHIVDEILGSDVEKPYFAFAHIMAPHQPNVRHADCSIRSDVNFDVGAAEDPEGYRGAVICLNRQFEAAVDAIVAADPSAIVILQGDHGTKLDFDPDHRLPILSAMRLPPPCADDVPESLTSVNTFRIVLNCMTDADYELLSDRFFWNTYEDTNVTEITEVVWQGIDHD